MIIVKFNKILSVVFKKNDVTFLLHTIRECRQEVV